ncbi:hypothetical protein BDV18DRAFT_147537 [Aspergillus unguis]
MEGHLAATCNFVRCPLSWSCLSKRGSNPRAFGGKLHPTPIVMEHHLRLQHGRPFDHHHSSCLEQLSLQSPEY